MIHNEPETIFIEDKEPTLEEMQDFVGGMIEVITLPDMRQMVINEEGKLISLPVNLVATNLWEKAFGIGTDVIVGNAMILDKRALLK
jgi:hypothetical protein